MKKITLILIMMICAGTYSDWELTTSATSNDLLHVLFVNSNTGYACGDIGTIIRTTNGGINWTALVSGTNEVLTSMAVNPANINVVYAAGFSGVLLKTTNAGNNWVLQTAGGSYNAIVFKDANTGVAAGLGGIMYRTTNGGNNWVSLDPGIGSVTISTLYIGGGVLFGGCASGKIIKSTNNGLNWTNYQTPSSFSFYSIYFPNDVTGYAVDNTGKVFKSSNSGVNWSQISVHSGTKFTITRNGIDLFMCGVQGKILKSTNNGVNWITQNTGTSIDFYAMQFVNAYVGFAVGEGGAIYRTSNGGEPIGINTVSSEVPADFSLSQNYPNPFNPATNLEFSVPAAEFVNITVYDALGKQVSIVVNEHLQAGKYKADFDGSNLNSGIYFYTLKAGPFTETKKMILLK
ncbi:MAG: T9SS type A sorting domain-containing protein [Ignavibacteria bacterium]|mgnify:CR=1 FL=1|nr:T9SS type A sorting domain-containing protein [Ignavibacteria bacterium]